MADDERKVSASEWEEMLKIRVIRESRKAILQIVSIGVSILSVFGIWSIHKATKPIDNIAALRDSLQSETKRLRSLAESVRVELGSYRTAMTTNSNLMHSMTSSYTDMLQTFPGMITDAATEARVATNSSQQQQKQLETDFNTALRDFNSNLNTFTELHGQYKQRIANFDQEMRSLRQRALETWTYTLREGKQGQDLRGSGTDFRVHVDDVEMEERLLHFTITNSRTADTIYHTPELLVGRERQFTYGGKSYQIYVPWALNTGSDANARRGGRYTDVFGLELRLLGNATQPQNQVTASIQP